MKHVIGVLYLLTAGVGLYWSIYLTMTGLYGVPFSRWYIVLLIGGLLLLMGAIFWWTSARKWTRWFPIVGSSMLTAYFLPAFVRNLPDFFEPTTEHFLGLVSVALVVVSLVTAVRNRHVGRVASLHS